MWKCSTKEESSCCCNPKITVLLGGLVLIVLFSVWLMAKPTDPMAPTNIAPPLIESEKCLIGIVTATTHLTEADHEAALTQGKCPVMGVVFDENSQPVKLQHEGCEVFVCCRACVTIFENHPDRYLANLQGTCPVSGVSLVTVETPVKIIYEGRCFYVCDEECKQAFLANPEKYQGKLRAILHP